MKLIPFLKLLVFSLLLLEASLLSACSQAGSSAEQATLAPLDPPSGSSQTLTIPDEEAIQLMNTLSNPNVVRRNQALQRILSAQDMRFVPVLIEWLRAAQLGLVSPDADEEIIAGLQNLSGQNLAYNWADWIEWYGATDLTPPPGFTSWKGNLLGKIDPRFADFLKDEYPSRLRVEEIQWGGVLVDGIPALDNPQMIPAVAALYLSPEEPVFGIALNGDVRAYPLRILDWHEMANDVVGGVPISLAYCTLCGAGIAYDGRASDGNTYTFGSSGFLFRSNKLMYDRQTNTLWNQLTGEPVLGKLAGTETRLALLPVVLTTWQDWVEQHPDTQVLSIDTGFSRSYDPGAAYGDYYADKGTMFPVWQRSKALPDKARIYALQIDGLPKAYELTALTEERVLNDVLGETALVLVAQRGTVKVEGSNLRIGPTSYDSGGEVRAYQRGNHSFTASPNLDILIDEHGQTWQVMEDALIGPDGKRLERIPGHLAYWFGWFAFFPNTQLFSGSD